MLSLTRACSSGALRKGSANICQALHIYPSVVVSCSPLMTSAHLNEEKKRKFVKTNHGTTGPLLSNPDYSYRDGRAVRLSNGERFRVLKQRELVEQSLRLLRELKYAKERNAMMTAEETRIREETIQQKFEEKRALAADPKTGRIARRAAHKRIRDANL